MESPQSKYKSNQKFRQFLVSERFFVRRSGRRCEILASCSPVLPFPLICCLFEFTGASCQLFPCWIVRLFSALPAVLWDAKPILAPRKHSDIGNRVVSRLIRNAIPLTATLHSSDITRIQTTVNPTSRIIELKSP